NHGLSFEYLKDAFINTNHHGKFFNNFFYNLAGNKELKRQVENNMSDSLIKASWQKDLNDFKKIREKYLLYPDFKK
ncbi:MAG: DUF1343 domain-containing protein, partial [Bacteroidota bacterium]